MLLFKKTLLILIVWTASTVAFACGNEYYYTTFEVPFTKGRLDLQALLTDPHDFTYPYWYNGFGEDIYTRKHELSFKITPHPAEAAVTNSLTWPEIEQALKSNTDYKLLSDYAWYELRVGDKKTAVRLLERLYEKYPNEYNVLANLGTAYEVIGKNNEALALLKKAVAINPVSHHGSEWIHINILEQKIKSIPDYKMITDLKAQQDYPVWLSGTAYDKSIPADSLMIQLAYQLHERIGFVRAPDAVVAQLVMDFADLVAIKRSREEAKDFYKYAVSYDFKLRDAANKRMGASVKEIPVKQVSTSSIKTPWLYITIGLVLVIISVYVFARQKKIRS